MVDNFSNKKVSDFIYKGLDEQNPKISNQPNNKKTKDKEHIVEEIKQVNDSAKMSVKSNFTTTASEYEGNTMTINEEVKVTEWAPAVFHAIKKMDNITP